MKRGKKSNTFVMHGNGNRNNNLALFLKILICVLTANIEKFIRLTTIYHEEL